MGSLASLITRFIRRWGALRILIGGIAILVGLTILGALIKVRRDYDLFGPASADIFFEDWTQAEQRSWISRRGLQWEHEIVIIEEYYGVPKDLLLFVVANEMIDYTGLERLGEILGLGHSLGPAQLTEETLEREGLLSGGSCSKMQILSGQVVAGAEVDAREALNDRVTNLCLAARLLRRYCLYLKDAVIKQELSPTFQQAIMRDCCRGANSEACTFVSDPAGENLSSISVTICMLRAIAALWNNGSAVISLQNVGMEAPGAVRRSNSIEKVAVVFRYVREVSGAEPD